MMDADAALVAAAAKNQPELLRFLASCGCPAASVAASAGEARRLLDQREYPLLVIAAPLPDEFGRELALYAVNATGSGVLLITASLHAAEIAAHLEPAGVAVVPSPASRQTVTQALHLLRASRQRMLSLREENRRLARRLSEMKLITRAKCALIQYSGFTEEEAHHTLERRAMDRRIPFAQAAQEVLAAYEEGVAERDGF